MSFLEIVERARAFLERNKRVSLRALQLEFQLDDDQLEALIEELVDVQQLAARAGKVLDWVGPATSSTTTTLAPPAPLASLTPEPLTGAPDAERRQLTVLFCDLVDSTRLASRLDPEDWREVVRQYQQTCGDVMTRFGGHVAQYLGDGLLVYFGYPRSYEDNAERAVRAGLQTVQAIRQNSASLEKEHGLRLAVRIGIHTGLVVVGEMGSGGRREILALGETPNIAARIESIAEPGSVMISSATLRLVAGLFVTEDGGTPSLRGISESIRVYRVLRQASGTRRLDRASALTPFIGRQAELGTLADAWEQTLEGRGQAALIQGEAGIGKSRICYELRERLAGHPHTWHECSCSPYTSATAFRPISELVERTLGIHANDAPDERLAKLGLGLERSGFTAAETVPLLAEWLGLPEEEAGYVSLELSAPAKRKKTLDALTAWILHLGEHRPAVVLIEDLHWCDRSSLELLGRLVAPGANSRVLLVLTARPAFECPWSPHPGLQILTVARLSENHSRKLIDAVSGEQVFSESLLQNLATRADGVPLYAEELTRAIVETGGEAPEEPVPVTLQDSLLARLDRLSSARGIAQSGSVLGHEFSYALLAATTELDERALQDGLDRLVDADLLYQSGLAPEANYTFKHSLVQDMAYQSLLKRQRREIHGRVADTLEKDFPDLCDREPELVARHFREAGRAEKAIDHYQRAAEQSTRHSAHAEAIEHLENALALVQTISESDNQRERELQLRIALGIHLQAARGMSSSEVLETYERALVLARGLPDSPKRFQALSGLAIFYRNHEGDRACELGVELLAHAERTGDPSQLLFAHSNLGIALHYGGEVRAALEHQERAISLQDSVADRRSLEFVYGLDPSITSLCFSSFGLLQLGFAERALERVDQAIGQARAHGHPYSLAYALNWGAIVHHERGEPRLTLQCAKEAVEISEAGGLAQQLAGASIYRACALALISGDKEARRAIDGVSMSQRSVPLAPVTAPFLAAIADAQRSLGRLDEALGSVHSWLRFADERHVPYWNPEFIRLEAEILLAKDSATREHVESLLRQAVSIARSQEGKSLEIRAANSLARLLRDQGRNEEALELLQPIYDWFTEGLDTKDLRDATALLA
jgi:class 3 adenylate cyclase/tetratricopeptide (TPR) repeat protein